MASKYSFVLTEKAEADLDQILNYIAVELDNPQAASNFLDRIIEVIDIICCFPDSGAQIDNPFVANKNVRFKVIGNFILYYLADHKSLQCYVLRIVYGGRDLTKIDFIGE